VRVLALDTSSPTLSCALMEDDRVLAQAEHPPPAKAGDLLPFALGALGSLDEVQAIAVGLGPGSFTGLRVGLAAAKALAYARKLPLAGASSLRALALGAGPGLICPALEARKGELFIALYRDGEELWPEQVVKAAELALPPGAVRVGPGKAPSAAWIARLCLPRLRGAAWDEAACFALAPNYLQASTAEVALAEGRVGGLPKA
jgi:tRNA threonylcarbamoyladenosine biosynthesis protein TsaB